MADDSRLGHISRPWHAPARARDLLEPARRAMLHVEWQRLRDAWVAVPVAGAVAVAVGAGVLGSGSMSLAVAVTVCLAYTVIAFKSPYVGLVIFLPSVAILPWDGYIRGGLWVPAFIRLAAPVLLCSVLFGALSARMKPTFRLTGVDAVVGFVGLFGFLNLPATGGTELFAKSYAKAMLFPLFFYFIARFMDWDRGRLRRLLRIQLGATAVCALLMVVESVRGGSLLYRGAGAGEMYGVHIAVGPFGAMYLAASFLCLWPSLFLYAAATAKRPWARAGWLACAAATLIALMRTQQRAMIAGAALGLVLCLLPRHMRKMLVTAGCVVVVVMAPVCLLARGPTWVLERFREPTKGYTRDAYNAAAIGILGSSEWDPVWGVGFSRFGDYALRYTPPELLERAFRSSPERLAARGFVPRQHNIALTLLVEFGVVHAALFVAVLLGVGYHWLQCFRPPGRADVGLLVALLGVALAALFSAWFHNLYIIAQATVYLWFFAGLIVGHKQLFRLPTSSGTGDADNKPSPAHQLAGAAAIARRRAWG